MFDFQKNRVLTLRDYLNRCYLLKFLERNEFKSDRCGLQRSAVHL